MNDPDGPLFWRGNYHMFYQYNPDGAYWGNMHWGHAISPDMVHWKHLPVALSPTAGGPDAAGCFTGTSIVRGNQVAVVYTGVTNTDAEHATIHNGPLQLKEMQCLAIGSGDDLLLWNKLASPVVRTVPKGLDLTGFRDPSPWPSKDIWYMVIGSGIRKKYGVVLLYRSKDLKAWEYMHIAATGAWSRSLGDRLPTEGDMWECPDVFQIDGKWVLIYSTGGKAFWQCGDWDSHSMRFRPRRRGLLDYGCMYAPKTQLDKNGKRVLWGWIRETRPENQYRAAGWAGVMSLPCILEIDEEYNLVMRVAPEVEQLRRMHQTLKINGDSQTIRRDIAAMRIHDTRAEIKCRFNSRTKLCGLFLETVGAGQPVTWMSIEFDPTRGSHLLINSHLVSLPGGSLDDIDLRVIVDASVMEIFIGTAIACTDRFYFAGTGAPELRPIIRGDMENLAELSIWQMKPISKDRLTS